MFGVQSFGSALQIRNDSQANINSLIQPYSNQSSLYNVAKFDISTFIDDSKQALSGIFNYAVSLYSDETIAGFISTYTQILQQFAALTPDELAEEKISKIGYLNTEQYHQIIEEWNQTDKDYPTDKTIHQLFEEQVEKTPDNIALVYEEVELTYRELNEKANQLAHYLVKNYGIKPDTLIALFLDRSEHMLIAILAVLKAGGAYIPIDPSYPDDRISYILEDTTCKLVLCNELHIFRLKNISDINLEAIDNCSQLEKFHSHPSSNPLCVTASTNLAYVIYTSGSTGKPKGVLIPHNNVLNFLIDMQTRIGISYNDSLLSLTTISFDIAALEIYLPIITGAKVIIAPNYAVTDAYELMRCIKNTSCTIMQATPATWKMLINSNWQRPPNFTILCGGEALSIELANSLNITDNMAIWNLYGPTEATIWSTAAQIKGSNNIHIGKPICNTSVYIFNNDLQPLPIGAIGELHIGGEGLARGYLNKEDLTRARFINNPFQKEEEKRSKLYGEAGKNARIYKTGDLVRWLANGNLEYICRNDFQVKIRGYRIELGEVESALSSYRGIKQNVVLVKEHLASDGTTTESKYLVGYYVCDRKLDEDSILEHIASKLPEYMVPSILVHLEKLPITINGKLDRKALPDPKFIGNSDNYLAPRNAMEQKIVALWAELLCIPLEKIGIKDDFFKLGGDSILSMQLVSRLRQSLGLNISVKDIFAYKNIECLYDNVLCKQQMDAGIEIKQEMGNLTGEVPLLPIQEYFFNLNLKNANHYNQGFIIKTPTLDLEKLKDSISKLVQHHDAFKLRFKSGTQFYNETAHEADLKVLDLSTLEAEEGSKDFDQELHKILTEWQSNFDIENGPIYTVGYIYGYKDGSTRVFFSLHHLIIDAISIRILADDINYLYRYGKLQGKGSSYRQWSESIKAYALSHDFERSYWNNTLSDLGADSEIFEKNKADSQHISDTKLEFDSEVTGKLMKEANSAFNTQLQDILISALASSLHEFTGRKVHHVLMRSHGRAEIDRNIDISRTLGWFSAIYPIRLEANSDLGGNLLSVKETIRQVPNLGIGYGALFGYGNLAPKLPKVNFNYLGQFNKGDSDKQSEWHLVDEDTGLLYSDENFIDSTLLVSGAVIDGQLQIGISGQVNQEAIDSFAKLYKQELLKIKDFALRKDSVECTMSDFEDFQPYVIFNQNAQDDRQPIFILPPGEGGAESYINNIVPQLLDNKLVVFNNYYLHLHTKFGSKYTDGITYETLARDYICYIKSIKAKGPYNLLGWSFGGVLAFEIARQLEITGEEVANIFIIDSHFQFNGIQNHYLAGINKLGLAKLPFSGAKKTNANVVLFKATKDSKRPLELTKNSVNKPKTKQSEYNDLDNFVQKDLIHLYKMDHDHFSWIYDSSQVQVICALVKKMVNRLNSQKRKNHG
jgi:amino acid adenylation domain-containing protein/non-ribosomal peptide synthase protein (TIGR01720 family)